MTEEVPQRALLPHYLAHQDEYDAAVRRVLASGWYVLGPEVEAFERAFSEMLGGGTAVGVASGTDAIVLALRALGIVAGRRVATVSHTATATVTAIDLAGASPVFVDVDELRMTMDPEALEQVVRTTPVDAVVVVHLYGQPADMEGLRAVADRVGAPIVEDCAQAHGARIGERHVGTSGAASAFSFYPTKNLGGFGDGGLVWAPDERMADDLRALRQYGWRDRFVSSMPGFNSRLDEMQAAMLQVGLAKLPAGTARRSAIADAYLEAVEGSTLRAPAAVPGTTHAWHQFVVRCQERDALVAHLSSAGVRTAVHYPQAVHQQPTYRSCERGSLSRTEALVPEVLSLPMYPELTDAQVEQVVAALRSWQPSR